MQGIVNTKLLTFHTYRVSYDVEDNVVLMDPFLIAMSLLIIWSSASMNTCACERKHDHEDAILMLFMVWHIPVVLQVDHRCHFSLTTNMEGLWDGFISHCCMVKKEKTDEQDMNWFWELHASCCYNVPEIVMEEDQNYILVSDPHI